MKKIKLVYGVIVISVLINVVLVAKLTLFKEVTLNSILNRSKDPVVTTKKSANDLFEQINPEKGYEINVSYGELGPLMIESGIIDLEKFKSVYAKSNQPLTPQQEEILNSGSSEKIIIDRDNSYFLLNFFWAVGLNNKSKILDEGEIINYGGRSGVGNFASTGGWSLARGDTMNYYSNKKLISLTPDQEKLVYEVTSNIFRPCCNNSTAFPDCNHGMALLGVMQLMAANGATEQEMYEAGKYFNAFWFPGNYYDIALYFKDKEGKSFKDIDAQTLLSKDYSSASGWQSVKQQLANKGLIQQPPKQGGGCGV